MNEFDKYVAKMGLRPKVGKSSLFKTAPFMSDETPRYFEPFVDDARHITASAILNLILAYSIDIESRHPHLSLLPEIEIADDGTKKSALSEVLGDKKDWDPKTFKNLNRTLSHEEAHARVLREHKEMQLAKTTLSKQVSITRVPVPPYL